jgi:hypothetical protein
MHPLGGLRRAPLADVNIRCRAADGHVQGADRQVLLHPIADGPADYSAGMQVQDDGQIDPALPRPDIGYVTGLLPGNGLPANHERAFLVWLARSKILLQEIWRDVEHVVAPFRPIALQSPAGQRSVVALNLWVLTTQIAFCRIRRPTLRCPTRKPSSFSSSVIRGRP